jgi:hypothetical protein
MGAAPELTEQLREMSAPTMVRGDAGFGRKPKRGFLKRLAEQVGPVDIHHHDQVTGETTIETLYEYGKILEANKRDLLSDHDGYSPSRDLRHVARIPIGIVNEFYRKGLNIYDRDDWEIIKALLDSSEWSALRTSEGTLSKKPRREYIVPAGRG